jgi:hypothetical protein
MDSKKKSYTIKVNMVITGFECSPEHITNLIGVNPTKVWKRGEIVHPKAKNIHKESGWLLSSQRDAVNSSIDEQISTLSNVITPILGNFHKLPEGLEIELSCIINAYEYMPPICFSTDSVAFASKLGASIDVDIYDLIEDEG